MSSFERVFNLAKKTGDRMIVFDSATGHGFAAIPLDEYEDMVSDPRDVREMSGDELLEQMNHDIALWRAHQEELEKEEFADILEEKMADEPPFDPFSSVEHAAPAWHTAADVIQDRYSAIPDSELRSSEMPYDDEIDFDDELEDEMEPDDATTDRWDPYQDLDMTPRDPEKRSIPERTESGEEDWQEEPLDEEPIFFEEPIE